MRHIFMATLFLMAIALAQISHAQQNPSKKYALIIGVNDYQPLGHKNNDRRNYRLTNLIRPCPDAESIASQLGRIGWTYDIASDRNEVEVMCNQTDDTIAGRLKELLEQFDEPDSLLFIYMAGHGVQINGRNYYFTHQATLDMEIASRRLTSNSTNVVFQGQSIELVQDIFSRTNNFYNGNIVLILDTCRNDPLYLETIRRELPASITSPYISQRSDGIMVLYATTPGLTISDGVSVSHLADSLVRNMKPGATIDAIMGDVSVDVRNQTRNSRLPQSPERAGSLNNSKLCLSNCPEPQSRYGNSTEYTLLDKYPDSFRFFHQWDEQQSAVAAGEAVHDANVFEISRAVSDLGDSPNAMLIDVLWCEDGGLESGRDAMNLAARISRQPGVLGGAQLERVRVRSIKPEENRRSSYRLNSNTIRIDPSSTSQIAWAAQVKSVSEIPLNEDTSSRNSLDSLSIFLCGKSEPPKPASRLWVHVPSESLRWAGSAIGDDIRNGSGSLNVESYIDVVSGSPRISQVRYFHASDIEDAKVSVELASKRLNRKPKLVYMPEYADEVSPGRLELWLGKSQGQSEVVTPEAR